jgi:hypothetical protein
MGGSVSGIRVRTTASILVPDGRVANRREERTSAPLPRAIVLVLRSDPATPGRVVAASSHLGRRVDRTLVRPGWFPAALFQRLALEPA